MITVFEDKMPTENWTLIECIFPVQIFYILKWKQQKYSIRAGEGSVFSSTETGPWATGKDSKGTLEICARCSLHNLKHPKFSVQISFNKV